MNGLETTSSEVNETYSEVSDDTSSIECVDDVEPIELNDSDFSDIETEETIEVFELDSTEPIENCESSYSNNTESDIEVFNLDEPNNDTVEASEEYTETETGELNLSEENTETDSLSANETFMQERANIDRVSQYYAEHNYSQGDFETYSKDPEWQSLIKQAYPDYELPDELVDTAGENVDAVQEEFSEIRNNLLDDFENMGIEYKGIDNISFEKSVEIRDAIQEMQDKYPEIKDLLKEVEITDELEDGTYATTGPRIINNQLAARILINQREFTENLEQKLNDYKEKGFFAGEGADAVIKHENGHILQLKLDAMSQGIESDNYITGEVYREKYNAMIDDWKSNKHTDIILDNALENLSLSHDDIPRELSMYANVNSAEALAEAVSEVNTSDNPRRLATEIVKEYEKLKSEMEEKQC